MSQVEKRVVKKTNRETLHQPLFEDMFTLFISQYAAQTLSGRFLPNTTLTTGNRRFDSRVLNRYTRVYVPIIQENPNLISMLKIFETGTPFHFEENNVFFIKRAFTHLENYLSAAIAYLKENYEEVTETKIDDYSRLGALADELARQLNLVGYQSKKDTMLSFMDVLSGKGNNFVRHGESTYSNRLIAIKHAANINRNTTGNFSQSPRRGK